MNNNSALSDLLNSFRQAAVTEREKGTYFEELIACYLRNEASYRDLYSQVWIYSGWASEQGFDRRDTGIDLVAKTTGTGEYHAIQCKLYSPDYRLQKGDIDSFFTASGKKPFTHRIIVSTTNYWSTHAEEALRDQQPPVSKIDLNDLENSQIDWAKYQLKVSPVLKVKKQIRPHQKQALDAALSGLQTADRGKLIMACGTGKTFTSLKIAEALAGKGKRVLFLVPSLSLLSQTLTEWTQESALPLHSFAVCSDSDVGKKRQKEDDSVQTFTHELRYPATTEAARLASEMANRHDDAHMSVVFSTYHSIDVISRAQKNHGLADFDLIVCDEAHRTTGATFGDDDESNFVKVHDAAFIRSAKRLYMTATPRIYSDAAEAKAEQTDVRLYGMNKEEWYGPELHVITFSEAVRRGLLVDYKVIVLSVEESHVSRRIQSLLKDENNQLKVDDAAKIIGCWKALAKQGLSEELNGDHEAMKRAVAFCQVIEVSKGAKTHKVSSKNIAGMFQAVVEAYQSSEDDEAASTLACEADHVDGSMNASEKEAKLAWLKADAADNTCRVLSNVRCLSEGVDVPALDAVLFLTPRNSQVDVVQSVGRVMRNAPGKKRGYVVLPVVIPAGVEPHDALSDNKTYAVVWQVLQALRSHDDRFDAMVNKLDLIGRDTSKMEVVAITDKIQKKSEKAKGPKNKDAGKDGFTIGEHAPKRHGNEDQASLPFEIGEIEKAIYAKLVQKVGNRHHWEEWANDIAKIARTHIDRITGIVSDPTNEKERAAFNTFADELRDDLNGSISDGEVIEMLAQHLITKPVFDALFEDYSFAQHNPMSLAMQGVLDVLQEHRLDKEADTLQRFYDSVKMRAQGIDNAAGKQKIIVELYDKFFANAFPRLRDKLGIVYTPVEVVDFIIHSVNDILKSEFGQTLGSKGVHIIDPFTGTGTFITRLLQSGLITPEQLQHKYQHEIHANEIVLLAYYIAAINIEAVYHSIVGGSYQPFEGICLTDTFQLYEKEDLVDALLVQNSARRKRQKDLDIRVIMGNPPYSAGQASANDNNRNVTYELLDKRVEETYSNKSLRGTGKRSLYDSYVKAIRWASDRVKEKGIISFITNGSFIDSNTMDGLRACLANEFSQIYCFNLRGNIRAFDKTEGENIFGSASMTPVAITILIKNPEHTGDCELFYHDIGEFLNKKEKLEIISNFGSVAGVKWERLLPNANHDWINHRNVEFERFVSIGNKGNKLTEKSVFEVYSLGVVTSRDNWVYNSSKNNLINNVKKTINFYNKERERFFEARKKDASVQLEGFIEYDLTQITWDIRKFQGGLKANKGIEFNAKHLRVANYRPFSKQNLYFNKELIHSRYSQPKFFPIEALENLVICVSCLGGSKGLSVMMADGIADLHFIGDTQCFAFYTYESIDVEQGPLFDDVAESVYRKKENITDSVLKEFQKEYSEKLICKEDIFYYVYGLLHSEEYRKKFASDLRKMLPRIPYVKTAADFWAFSKAGRDLADLHLNYETVAPYPLKVEAPVKLTDADYRVEKMKYGKKGKDKDLTTLQYNDKITLTGIPLEAYDYVVNGKPALDWVVERQCVKIDKDSGIINDANDWAIETMGNPRYPLDLFQRVITVSLETMRIVKALPKLEIGVVDQAI